MIVVHPFALTVCGGLGPTVQARSLLPGSAKTSRYLRTWLEEGALYGVVTLPPAGQKAA